MKCLDGHYRVGRLAQEPLRLVAWLTIGEGIQCHPALSGSDAATESVGW